MQTSNYQYSLLSFGQTAIGTISRCSLIYTISVLSTPIPGPTSHTPVGYTSDCTLADWGQLCEDREDRWIIPGVREVLQCDKECVRPLTGEWLPASWTMAIRSAWWLCVWPSQQSGMRRGLPHGLSLVCMRTHAKCIFIRAGY